MRYDNEHQKACQDMLVFHGIDPMTVPQDGVYTEGYDTFRLDIWGKRVVINDELATESHAWPINFPVASFFEHYWAWKRAVV